MLFLKSKLLIFPKWVWLYGLLGWFSAEIVTVSTPVNKIDIGTIVFSIPYYLLQLTIVADIIARKKPSLFGLFLIGLIYGILEETFYIKNPPLLTLLLTLGHSAVTVTLPYLLVNYLIPGEKQPFLGKKGYILIIFCLAALYAGMAMFLPFTNIASLLLGIILTIILLVIIKLFWKKQPKSGKGAGFSIKEKLAVIFVALLATISSQQNYLGVIIIFLWFILRQKTANSKDIYFVTILFLIFHFLGSIFNKSADPANLWLNYQISFTVGLLILFLLWRKRNFLQSNILHFN